MVDPVGAVLGVAGLAGLFSTCVQCFELVQLGRAYAKDFEILQTKFEAQKIRFLIWRQAVGVTDGASYDTRLDLPDVRPTVVRLLNCIKLLFSDVQGLNRRYGLRLDPGDSPANNRIIFRETYRRFHARISKTQSDAGFLTTARWAIGDKTKFVNLVQDTKDLIDSLEDITKSLQMLSRQQEIVAAELESITDATSLELLEEACSGSENRLSDAASRRLRILEGQAQGVTRPPTLSTQLQALSVEDSFHTADSQFAEPLSEHVLIPPAIDPSVNDRPQNQRVLDQYRVQSPHLRADMPLRTSAPVPIDSQLVGLALHDMRQADIEHTKAVIRRFSQTSNPEQKRMVMILQNLLDSTVTPFVSLAPVGEDLFDLLGRIEGSPASPYQGGVFHVRLGIPGDFPWMPPKCRFLTKIYHPNIDAQGKLCLDVLEPQNWRMELMYLESILLSISCLLDEPAIEDPLVPEIAAQFLKDRTVYDKIAMMYTQKYVRGSPVTLPQEVTRTTTASWKPTFLRERLHDIQNRATVLIQALNAKPDLSSFFTEQPSLSERLRYRELVEQALRKFTSSLLQLCSELAALSQIIDDNKKSHAVVVANFEELENFFDLCSGEFRAVVTDENWSRAFPQLPQFKNDTTRGTGQSYTYKFLYFQDLPRNNGTIDGKNLLDSDSRELHERLLFGIEIFVTPLLKRLEELIRHAQWLNGDESMLLPTSKMLRGERSLRPVVSRGGRRPGPVA